MELADHRRRGPPKAHDPTGLARTLSVQSAVHPRGWSRRVKSRNFIGGAVTHRGSAQGGQQRGLVPAEEAPGRRWPTRWLPLRAGSGKPGAWGC